MQSITWRSPDAATRCTLIDHFGLDRLEPRVLLSGGAFNPVEPNFFPALDLLENPANPVVRIQTTLGAIDIELFPDQAPGTVGRFLTDIRGGFLDDAAFHRLVPGQVLQVGPYGFTHYAPPSPLLNRPLRTVWEVETWALLEPFRIDIADAAIAEAQWTVSYSEVRTGTNTITSLTFNLTDNPEAPFDAEVPEGMGFATISRVIGRVLAGTSRDAVTSLATLGTMDLSGYETTNFAWVNPFLLDELPVLEPFEFDQDTRPPRRADLALITDAELIKPQGASGFYEHRVFYPEGFASLAMRDFVPVVNTNDEPVEYQLIARFESGERDIVLASGTIAANSRAGHTLAITAGPSPDGSLSPRVGAFALELVSTLRLAAALSHYDFGAATGEGFTSTATGEWHFADALVDQDFFAFLVWQNTAVDDASIEILFYPESAEGEIVTVNLTTQALRRGGLNLSLMGLPAGRYGIRIASSTPIVAALSQYDNRADTESASTELGVPQAISRGGALPLAQLGGSITMFNPADPRLVYLIDPSAEVTVTFTSADPGREPVQRLFTLSAGQIVRYDFADLADALGTAPFAVRFTADNYVVFRGARGHSALGDDVASPFSTLAAQGWRLAEGFMDPARAGTDVLETLGVYNTMNNLTVQNEVTVTFRFIDGTSISEVFSLSPGRHLFLDLHTFAPLLEQAAAGRNFYSIDVTSQFPVVAQLWHDDLTLGGSTPAGGFGTIGTPYGFATPLDGPVVLVPFV